MKNPIRYLLILPVTSIIFSCEYKEVKEDAKSYCACKNREYAGKAKPGECTKMLRSFKNKYEYLPEQQEILVLNIADCLDDETMEE